KALDLQDSRLDLRTEVRGGVVRAQIRADALAFFVTLEADRPGRFSTNAITVFPGRHKVIEFTPADGDPASVRLGARDLYSSYAPSRNHGDGQ
ncbi:MAG TPA: glycoside hydrolase family 2 protein, partial [Methylomirabilota bacterium]|nr:glycoside hydrolase family 2 protein [Methylomirabilota bacterium]